MPGKSLDGDISYVASVTKPAGWWTGNVVKYDTIVELPEVEGQKPGMTVEVEVVMARHKDVLLVPTTAVLETAKGHVCWVRQGDSTTRRPLKLGDSSDMFIQVEAGLAEGDEVILDPLANVEEAQTEAAKSLDSGVRRRSTDDEPKSVSPPPISD
jgi:multidrug efflux pump subunit AcrA (membrane-fusion protein)